jgi:hypothetical protein
MYIANQFQPDVSEAARSNYLKSLGRNDIRASRLLCETQLIEFEMMEREERDRLIAIQVMGWTPVTNTSMYYETHENFIRMDAFKPSQEMSSAFMVFDYTLIEDKITLVPCSSASGRFWSVNYEDMYVAASLTAEMAICKASIVINDAVLLKMNVT